MKRRLFLLSGSASAALAVTGCGGGGSDAGSAAAGATPTAMLAKQRRSSTTPTTTTTTTTTTDTSTTTSGTTTTSTSGTTTTGALGYAFGSRLVPYAAGIRPTQTNTTMDSLLAKQYDAWKAARIVGAGSVAAGGYAVQFSNTSYLTVSEGMGYGMLLAVLFAGHDPQAQALFDGLLAVVRARPAYAVAQYDTNGKYLMDWRINANGTAGDGWNAMDGDLDIAMALLMAHKQWGSAGTWNYLQEGKNTIAALKSWNMAANGATKGLAAATNNRTSDYMIGHFRAFKAATGDAFWDMAVDRAYFLIDNMQTVYSAGVGLMPDFVMRTDTTTPCPSTGYIGDGNANEGYFWWNACRNPWRYSSDFLLSADPRFATVTGRMIDFFQKASGGDPYKIGTGYALNGTMLTGGNSPAYHGPICAGACIDTRFQSFLDTMWNWNATHLTTGYYDSEIQLLSMVVASGNWWTPGSTATATTSTTSPTSSTNTSTSNTTTTGGTTTTTATTSNILSNGDFAGGLTGWNNWGNSSVVGGALNVGTAAGGVGQDIYSKVQAGTKYQVTATANITLAAEGVYVGVKLMDANGNVLVNQSQLVTSLTPTGVTLSFTAPQGVASGYVYVWKNANTAIGVVDNFSLTSVA